MDKTVILISGKKEAGKNTVADYLSNRLQEINYAYLNVPIISFADELKKTCHNLFGIPMEWMYGTNEDKNRETNIPWGNFPVFVHYKIPTVKMTVREVLQLFGTEICRYMDKDCWARAFFNHVDKLPNRVVINADARFPNELDFECQRKKIKIRLTRNVHNDTHKSEIALDDYKDFDFVLDNVNLNKEQTLQLVEDTIVTLFKN